MDYIMGEGEVRDRVIEMRIGERGIKGSTQTTTPWKYVSRAMSTEGEGSRRREKDGES